MAEEKMINDLHDKRPFDAAMQEMLNLATMTVRFSLYEPIMVVHCYYTARMIMYGAKFGSIFTVCSSAKQRRRKSGVKQNT